MSIVVYVNDCMIYSWQDFCAECLAQTDFVILDFPTAKGGSTSFFLSMRSTNSIWKPFKPSYMTIVTTRRWSTETSHVKKALTVKQNLSGMTNQQWSQHDVVESLKEWHPWDSMQSRHGSPCSAFLRVDSGSQWSFENERSGAIGVGRHAQDRSRRRLSKII